jgi:AraC family transcriptional regulator
MDPIERALWYINSHSDDDISLEDIAEVAQVSGHHLAHAFGRIMGRTVMGYVRGLRLTAAAHKLADGAPDILSIALESGYGSHEAFSRAFRDAFGVTPEELRATRTTCTLNLTEPLTMDRSRTMQLKPPRLADGKPMLIAGLKQTLAFDNMAAIPAQWQKFLPHLSNIPGQIGTVAYGVCFNMTDNGMDYLTGVEVKDAVVLPRDLARVRIPAHRYAVFRHDAHVAHIGDSWGALWGGGLEAAGHQPAGDPFFERYGPEFDGRTGEGGLELWVPIQE